MTNNDDWKSPFQRWAERADVKLSNIERDTTAALRAVETLTRKVTIMSAEIDRLTASAAAAKTAEDKLIAIVADLAAQIRLHANDPAMLTALADSLDAETAAVVAAAAGAGDAVTPAPAPAPAPAPTPDPAPAPAPTVDPTA